MSDTTARLIRHFHATPDRVFDAWTDPSLLAQWYSPNPGLEVTFEGEVVEGSDYVLTMGGQYVARGTYRVVDRPHALEFTWAWDHEDGAPSVVRVDIDRTSDGTTRLTLVHSDLPSADDATGHAEGWDLQLNRLVVLLGCDRWPAVG
ncbi:MAG: SRPBCC domain-containing protein [Mobilicoccus sp.]|nr:SRPBCC domain-containing protein [Mobilicoccus sp.]